MAPAGLRGKMSLAVLSAVAIGAFLLAFTRITDPDLGFHLATGRAVLALGHVPATNVLSYTEPDHPWILHEWLPAILFELAWRKAGPAGVLALRVVVVVATWPLVWLAARRWGASPIAAGVATVLGAGAAAIRFADRPQIFSNLALAGCAVLLAGASDAREGRRRLVGAGLVAACTAQIHAGAVTSFALLACVAVGIVVEPVRARLFHDEVRGGSGLAAGARVAVVLAASIGIAALALALYHPQGARPLLVAFQLGADADLHEHVVEYRPPYELPFQALHAYWAFAAISAIAVVARARRLPAALLVPFLAFGALSLRHARTVDAFAVVAAPVLALGLDGLVAGRLDSPRVRLAGFGVLVMLALGLPVDRWSIYPPGPGIASEVWPTALFDFIQEQGLTGPAFVSDGWAGPFLGVFYPRERAFFDPRFEAYSPEFVRDVYRSVRYGEPGWASSLDRFGVQLVLLKYTSAGEAKFQGGRENVRQLLARSPAWALVGFTDTGEIFVRREGPNAGAVARFGIAGVEPDRGIFLGAPALAAPSLVRAVNDGFHDNRVLSLAAVAVSAGGDLALAQQLLDRADAQRPGDPRVLDARAAVARVTHAR